MFDLGLLEAAEKGLGEAVLDPAMWPVLMDDICQGVGATGAALLQSDVRTPDVPLTPSVREYFASHYFADGLHIDDVRAIRGVPLLLAGKPVVVDQDLFASERELQKEALYASLAKVGLRWFAVVGFKAGDALWGLSIQRSPRQGAFDEQETAALARLAARLTETATLSKAVGRKVLTGISNAFDLLGEPAIAISRMGNVIEANHSVIALLDDDFRIKDQRIFVRDLAARAEMDRFLERLRTTPDTRALNADPIRIPRKSKRPLLIRALAVDGAAKSPFLGARAIFVINDLDRRSALDPRLIAKMLDLTPAQARVAALLGEGKSTEEIAGGLGINPNSVRVHLKAIFARTGTHHQADLVALLHKL
jgi:DNA-binding CsgD family transcriptional regulator